ncbi:MAG TPA: ABC transporter permease [Gemmatimonadaceae bacterium]|jgi:predicted permease|nr:ABC transporter permease [Gemmatimonadaceae bacterium]
MAGDESPKWHRYLSFWRANIAADIDAELAFHVDARTEELCATGLDRAAARAQALREFGDLDLARRTLRSMDERHAASVRRAHLANDVLGDVRVAVRALRRSPGLVAVVGLTFALGIGVTGAMYSVVDNILFKPLPGEHGVSLVVLGRTEDRMAQPHDLSFPDFRDFRADTAVFASLAAYTSRVVELRTDRGADRIWIDDATANYFAVLGLRPLLGRTFEPGEDRGALAHPTIVLTYKGWQAYFAGDSGVIGRVISINDHPVTVIGVMPPAFHGVRPLVDIDGVAPIDQVPPVYGAVLENRASTAVSVFGRLRPGVSLSVAREAVRLKARQLERAYPATNNNVGAVLMRERFARPSITVSGIAPAIAAMFMTLVMLVMLVASANIASLLLARVVARGRDLAVRAAIGASQWRLVRQVLVESALLAMLGGIGAVAVTYGAVRALESIDIATDIPIRWGFELNGRIIAVTAIATLIAALAAGIAPASAARKRNLNDVLRSGTGNSATVGHRRLRSALVAGQIAISVVVLVCAGLFVRSSANATRMNLGFRTDSLLMLSTELRTQSYDSLRGQQFYRELLRRAAAVPGAKSVALTRFVPFGYDRAARPVVPIAPGVPVPDNGFNHFHNVVAGDYFAAMGIPLLEGRLFTDRDDASAPPVAIVSDAFVNAVWPGQPAIGKRFRFGGQGGPIVEIVGVVRGMQDMILGETPRPYIFLPIAQAYRGPMTILVRTSSDPSAVARPIRAVIAGLDPSLPVFDVRTMDDHLRNGQALLFTRLGSAFATVFGLLALVLATVGVYGVVSYSVAQRTREIGVRMALGARRPAIVRLVVGQGLRLGWIGLGVGLVLSVATLGVVSSVLYGVTPRDPVVLGTVVCVLTLVVVIASLVPARRAMRIDPITSLRSQ